MKTNPKPNKPDFPDNPCSSEAAVNDDTGSLFGPATADDQTELVSQPADPPPGPVGFGAGSNEVRNWPIPQSAEPPEPDSAPDPFDPARLRLRQNFAAA